MSEKDSKIIDFQIKKLSKNITPSPIIIEDEIPTNVEYTDNSMQLFEMFLRGKSERTKKTYQNVYLDFLSFLEGTPIPQITEQDARNYAIYLSNKTVIKKNNNVLVNEPIKESTITKHLRTLLSFYKFLIEEGHIISNPFHKVSIPKQKTYIDTDRTLTLEELDNLLIAATESGYRDYAIILLFVTSRFTALEITNLKWGNFCRDAEGRWGAEIKTRGQKKDGSDNYRIVPIREDVMEVISLYRRQLHLPENIQPEERGEHVFLNRYNLPITDQGIRKMVYKLRKEAGIEKNISPKDLAHMCMVLGKYYGADVNQLNTQAGFKNLYVLEKYKYAISFLKDPACDMLDLKILNVLENKKDKD